jgi:hypothetical protein
MRWLDDKLEMMTDRRLTLSEDEIVGRDEILEGVCLQFHDIASSHGRSEEESQGRTHCWTVRNGKE